MEKQMLKRGFFVAHRSDLELFKDRRLGWFFYDLVSRANIADATTKKGRQIKRGEIVVSIQQLAKDWKVSKPTIYRWLSKLGKLILRTPARTANVNDCYSITIRNYERFTYGEVSTYPDVNQKRTQNNKELNNKERKNIAESKLSAPQQSEFPGVETGSGSASRPSQTQRNPEREGSRKKKPTKGAKLGQAFRKAYLEHLGFPYPQWGAKENAILKRWLSSVSEEKAESYVHGYFAWGKSEKFIKSKGYPLELLVTNVTSIAAHLAKSPPRNGEIPPGCYKSPLGDVCRIGFQDRFKKSEFTPAERREQSRLATYYNDRMRAGEKLPTCVSKYPYPEGENYDVPAF